MPNWIKTLLSALSVLTCCVLVSQTTEAASFGFVPGNYYSTDGYSHYVREFDPQGNFVAAIAIPGDSSLYGVAFGPDKQLYVTSIWSEPQQTHVDILKINEQGTVEQTYRSPIADAAPNLVFDNSGHFFLGQVRFDIGSPISGQVFLPYGSCGISQLPNGHFMAIESHDMYELDAAGNVVRDLYQTGDQSLSFVDLHGVAYDPHTDSIFATMSGYTGAQSKLMQLDFATGTLRNSITYSGGNGLEVTPDGRLFVGNFYGFDGAVFTTGLQPLLTLEASAYITQLVPEPVSSKLAAAAIPFLLVATSLRRMRTARRLARANQSAK